MKGGSPKATNIQISALYIPHGSDESSKEGTPRVPDELPLYPTWFRWKTSVRAIKGPPKPTLYPTWFRWKISYPRSDSQHLNALYPTWFRWKVELFLEEIEIFSFISHMVQMKGRRKETMYECWNHLYIPHGSDERQHKKDNRKALFMSLYPTWFRWKVTSAIQITMLISSLYPTWFRWKVDKNKHSDEDNKLYIPHGSDESKKINELDTLRWNTLYPTWFRWKEILLFYHPTGSFPLYPTWFRWKWDEKYWW